MREAILYNTTPPSGGVFEESGLCRCDDVYDLLADHAAVKVGLAAIAEEYLADNHRVEGVVMTDLHVLSRLDLGAALAHDNHAWASCLAVIELNPQEFWS